MTSRSCPEATSTIEVDHAWVRHRPWRAKSTSSTPRASTAPTRPWSASSRAVPYATTASLMECQSAPSSAATSLTARPARPTWTVAHRPARSVTDSRGAAIRGSSWVQDPTRHHRRGQCQRCLRHRNVTGRPKHVRSTRSTTERSLTHARSPQPGHGGASTRDSTVITRHPTRGSRTSSTFTAGRPTSSSHARVALNTAGAPRARRRQTSPSSQGPCYASGTPTPRSSAKRRFGASRFSGV
jgi:hypothetical protein